MGTKRLLRYLFSTLAVVLLAVIAFNIAVRTNDLDISVFAQNSATPSSK